MDKNKNIKWTYIVAFFMPVIILSVVYGIRGVYPISNKSVLVLDLNAQYVYYYEAFRDAFYNGKSLWYSFSRTLGGEMVGIYAYYLASPFSVVLLLFSQAHITEAVLMMILLKVGSAGLTFYLYITKSRKVEGINVLFFSTLYALSGYVIVQTMNPMWLDAVIFLPMIIWGIEQLIDNGKYIMLIVFLTLTFISNFYIGYMTGVFVGVYFLYYIFAGSNKVFDIRHVVNRILIFTGTVLVSVAMAAWLIIPTYLALKMGKFTFSNPDFMPEQQLNLLQLFAKALPLSYDSVNYHGLPFIYCGIITLILVALYFFNDTIIPKKKIGAAIFIFIMILCFTISTVDIVLHGFQAPNWLNYRYSFILSFFVLTLAFDSFNHLGAISGKKMLLAILALVFMVMTVGDSEFEFIVPEITIWFSYGALLLYGIAVFALRDAIHERISVPHVGLAVLIIIELIANTIQMTYAADAEVVYSSRDSYVNYFNKLQTGLDYIEAHDDSFHRTETLMRRTVNDPMALGVYGLSNSSSILNSHVIEFLKKLGISSKDHWTKYKGMTIFTDSFTGVKYVFADEEHKLGNAQYEEVFTKDDLIVYENPYALPIMFIASDLIKDVKFDERDPFVNQNRLLNAIVGNGDEIDYFKLLKTRDTVFENITPKKMADTVSYKAIDPDINAHIEYIVETAGDNPMYLYLYSQYPRKINLWKDKEFIDTFFESNSTCIMPLGVNKNKETISLITTPTEEEYYLTADMFYYLDVKAYENAINNIKMKQVEIEKKSETHLIARVDGKQGMLLQTTIPYEKGWNVYVNDEKVTPIKTLDALMAIELTEGQQVIEFKFVPNGLVAGSAISIVAVVIFGILVLVEYRKKKQTVVIENEGPLGEETDEVYNQVEVASSESGEEADRVVIDIKGTSSNHNERNDIETNFINDEI